MLIDSVSVVVAGHVCLDFMPAVPEDVEIVPGRVVDVGPLSMRAGGCVSNTSADLLDLGASVRSSCVVGDDDLGNVLRASLRARGIDDRGVIVLPGATTSYSIVLDRPGTDRAIWHHVGANAAFDPGMVDVAGAAVLHVGYPPLLWGLMERDGAPLADLFAAAKAANITTSLDFAAVHPRRSGPDWAAVLRRVLPHTDIVTPSVDDVSTMLHRSVDRTLAARLTMADHLLGLGAAVVMMTAGEDGAVLRSAPGPRLLDGGTLLHDIGTSWSNVTEHADALDAAPTSTTGAGDAATAGFLVALLHRQGPQEALNAAMSAAAHRVRGAARLPVYDPPTDRSGLA